MAEMTPNMEDTARALQEQAEKENEQLLQRKEEEDAQLRQKEEEEALLLAKDEEERLRKAEIDAGKNPEGPDFFDRIYEEISDLGQTVIDTLKDFYAEKKEQVLEKVEDVGLALDGTRAAEERAKMTDYIRSLPEDSLDRSLAENLAADAKTARQLEVQMNELKGLIRETDPKEVQEFFERDPQRAATWECKYIRDCIADGSVKSSEDLVMKCLEHEQERAKNPERARQEDILAVKESIDLRLQNDNSLSVEERRDMEDRSRRMKDAADFIDRRFVEEERMEALEKFRIDKENGDISFDKADYADASKEEITDALKRMDRECDRMEEKHGDLGKEQYEAEIHGFTREVVKAQVPPEDLHEITEELNGHGYYHAARIMEGLEKEVKTEQNKDAADVLIQMTVKHNELKQGEDEKAYADFVEKDYIPFIEALHNEYPNYGQLKEELGDAIRENPLFQENAKEVAAELQEQFMSVSDELQVDRLYYEFEKGYFKEHFVHGEELLVCDGLEAGVEDHIVIQDNQGYIKTYPLGEDQEKSVRDAMDDWSVVMYNGKPELAIESQLESGKTSEDLGVTKDDIEKYVMKKAQSDPVLENKEVNVKWKEDGTEIESISVNGDDGIYVCETKGQTVSGNFSALAAEMTGATEKGKSVKTTTEKVEIAERVDPDTQCVISSEIIKKERETQCASYEVGI